MKSRNNSHVVTLCRVLFILYLILLAYFLFFSERYGRTVDSGEYRYNLTLFKEIKRFITYRNQLGFETFVVNIAGNVLAFAPFGFILPIISLRNRNIIKITLLSFELSLIIETIQLMLKVGIFDVDDLVMNTFGAMLGAIAFHICNKLIMKKRKKG